MRPARAVDDRGCSLDLAPCSRCGRLLSRFDYGTDPIGRSMENCPSCGPKPLAIRSAPKVGNQPLRGVVRFADHLCECGNKVVYAGMGIVPKQCQECRAEKKRVRALKRYHAHQAELKFAVVDPSILPGGVVE